MSRPISYYLKTFLCDLIAHYIEESVITSREELISVLNTLKKQLGILVREKTFEGWWAK